MYKSYKNSVKKDTKEFLYDKKFEILPLNIEAPLIYYSREISKSKSFVKEDEFQYKILGALNKYAYEELLEKIKLIFGNTSLRSVLLGIAFISQVENVPTLNFLETMKPLPSFEEWVKEQHKN